MSEHQHEADVRRTTRIQTARSELLDAAEPLERTEVIPVPAAGERVLAEQISAPRPVPHYTRAAMDGYAVRAEDTVGATERSPVTLRVSRSVSPGTAVPVHTGSELPAESDAVVRVEYTDRVDDNLEVRTQIEEGKDVAPVGEDVAAGEMLFDAGHRLRPADLGLLKSVGVDRITVYSRPEIEVLPTGDELVLNDPSPGEMVESNGLVVSRHVEQWGGVSHYRDAIPDDRDRLGNGIRRGLAADALVTIGGSSIGDRDIVPDVFNELGEVLFHGVAIKPGHPVGAGLVDNTPFIMLPGYPVSCIINSVQLLRPLVKYIGHLAVPDHPSTQAVLSRGVTSEYGRRSYVRVMLDPGDELPEAVPVRSSGAGVLSSVTSADGWIVIPEDQDICEAGTTVQVEDWEWTP